MSEYRVFRDQGHCPTNLKDAWQDIRGWGKKPPFFQVVCEDKGRNHFAAAVLWGLATEEANSW